MKVKTRTKTTKVV